VAQEFRYKISFAAEAVIQVDERLFRFKQGLRVVQVPLANVRAFGVRRRPVGMFNAPTSELILLTEPAPGGELKPVKMTFDPESAGGQAATAALAAALPAGADVRALPWREQAGKLRVPVRPWHEVMTTKWGAIGTFLVAGSAGGNLIMMILSPGGAMNRKAHAAAAALGLIGGMACLLIGHVTMPRND
jgi:hypothetical protein